MIFISIDMTFNSSFTSDLMINATFNVIATLLAAPSFFNDNNGKYDYPFYKWCSFEIRHETNIMMGLAWLKITTIILANNFGIGWKIEVVHVYGLAILLVWFTMAIQYGY